MDDKLELFNSFQSKWSIERMKTLSLEEYTSLNRDSDSFTYDIEKEMEALGSMWGGSSFKFGIYTRENKAKRENTGGRFYTDDYAWYKKYGSSPKEVFFKVRSLINDIIKNVQNNNLKDIDEIDLGDVYKWKIAFHFQDKNDISIIPVFKDTALKIFLEEEGYYKKDMKMSDMQVLIKNKYNISNLSEAIELAEKAWGTYNKYTAIDIDEEQEIIKANKNKLNKSKKTNATTSLEEIKYKIKAHRVKYNPKHNLLEKSFEVFLKANSIEKFIKDEDYIDFQFDLNNRKYICELKPSNNQQDIKYAIREAVGQILGYSFNRNVDFKIIIFQKRPNKENLEFLEYLEKEHNIYYLYEVKEGNFLGSILKI